MEKNSRQKSKGSINSASYNNNGSAISNKPPSRVKQPTAKRVNGSGGSFQYGENLNAAQCVEEIKNTFQTSASIEAGEPGNR